MSIKDLTPDQIEALVGTRHPSAGIEYPPVGLQPYYDWLIRSLHLLAESSFGALRVAADSGSDTSVTIAPGRATISGVALVFAGQTSELASFNNDTAYLWLADSAGQASVGIGLQVSGWPGTPHIKLAAVTLAGGQITEIVDRRFEAVFSV